LKIHPNKGKKEGQNPKTQTTMNVKKLKFMPKITKAKQ
jgi:translation initiation factor IF-3